MKQFLKVLYTIPLFILLINSSCSNNQFPDHPEKLVSAFIEGFNTRNFEMISEVTADSFQIIDIDYVACNGKEDLHLQFKKDSVFKPKYQLIDYKTDKTLFIAKISKSSDRIEFLQDTAITNRVIFLFEKNQIKKMKIIDYTYVDFTKWKPRKDSLNLWLKENYPELEDYTNQKTLENSIKYNEAIQLWNKAQKNKE